MADDLTVNREGDMLVIRIPIKTPTPSASGKTLGVASTRGNQKTGVQIDGKDLYLGVNAYMYADRRPNKKELEAAIGRARARRDEVERSRTGRRRPLELRRIDPHGEPGSRGRALF